MIMPSLCGYVDQAASKTLTQDSTTDSPVYPERYSESLQTSKLEHFVKIVNSWKFLFTFSKMLHIWHGSEYTSVYQTLNFCETGMKITNKGPFTESPMYSKA